MATKEFWIQIESHAWDLSPNDINRMTGEQIRDMGDNQDPIIKSLKSPVTGVAREVEMFEPVKGEALVLRRYTADWAAPDDRKVNPWDLNEPDPTDDGTMGTIPGPTIECQVGDDVIVHFRNMDTRDNKHELERTHSLHPHGIVFAPEHDGAYPLSPEDRNQPVDGEAALWSIPKLGVDGFKKSDRVPPGASFTYKWDTFSWPATAGVWLYHDHSICDHHNVGLGAIGFLVIHNSADEDDVLEQDLPSGDVNGALILNNKYVVPPQKAFYLQVYHEMRTEFDDRAMTINGRRWLGNTPTLIGGVDSKMRFGLIAMNDTTFHTFHLHGHRWVVPGPSGDKVGGEPPFGTGVQVSPLNKGVSQFEDTRIFGPANAFSFTINQGSFMGPPLGGGAKGEWHMHCHVLRHMMRGMMGSLLIVDQGDEATELPRGVKCPTDEDEDTGAAVTIVVDSFAFMPPEVTVSAGSEVTFHFKEEDHTVTTPLGGGIEINKGGGPDDPMDEDDKETVTISGNSGDEINYICGIHSFMKGKIRIT